MNGYYIQVTNNLLDAKHRENMGESVWLFMWLLDKMTSTDEAGVGKVLGGKPVKFEDVADVLGMSQRTYTRYIERLVEHDYITATRTPYGYVFHIMKAKKSFGKRVATSDASLKKRVAKSGGLDTPHMAGKSGQSGSSNKTVTEDNTVDSTNLPTGAAALGGREVDELIELFREVNPLVDELFRRKTERDAIHYLAERIGPEKLRATIAQLSTVTAMPYAPKITKPTELRRDLAKLITFYKQEQSKKPNGAVMTL